MKLNFIKFYAWKSVYVFQKCDDKDWSPARKINMSNMA